MATHGEQMANGGKLGGKIGGKASVATHGEQLANGGRIMSERWAKRVGLQGGEQCPGCDLRGGGRDGQWEECDVYKDGAVGRGSDGKGGLMVDGVWHCRRHGMRLRMRANRAGAASADGKE